MALSVSASGAACRRMVGPIGSPNGDTWEAEMRALLGSRGLDLARALNAAPSAPSVGDRVQAGIVFVAGAGGSLKL